LKSGIIFIGGASGSGKTSAANDLGKKKTLPVLSLDSIYNMFKDVIPKDVRVEKTESVCLDLIEQLLRFDAKGIVEGGWLQPEGAERLRSKYCQTFFATFCGYPEVDPEQRYTHMNGGQSDCHHLVQGSKDEAINKLRDQITASLSYRERCKQKNFIFCDFGEWSKGNIELNRAIDDWLSKS